MTEVNKNYKLDDTIFGPTITWSDCEQAGVALDQFQDYRQILIYDEDEETDEPVVIVRFNKQNRVVEVQAFRNDVLVLEQCDFSPWAEERGA